MKQRYESILEILKKEQFISVNELSKRMYISPSSIRRDLAFLEKNGYVKRCHGGVMPRDITSGAPPFVRRSEKNKAEKKAVATVASRFLQEGMTVFLDDSTSAYYMVEHIAKVKNITLITNNLLTSQRAIGYGIKTITVGGESRNDSVSMTGSIATDMISRLYADICFFSALSLSSDGEISDCTEENVAIKKAMIKRAKIGVFLCDGTKFGTHSTYTVANAFEIDHIVSDIALPDTIGTRCETDAENV